MKHLRLIIMTHGQVRQCKITTGGSVFCEFPPPGPDADRGHRQRSNTEQAHPMTLQRFRR